jgi:site-specific DNA-methyltransferase (adenine-specific)/site-specific DNA-methyltransferase (cytosine-N4-specific)
MYYYPDNVYEEIIVFKKPGEFDKSSVPEHIKEKSRIDVARFQAEKWYLSVWDIKNVLPQEKWTKYTAVFPEEIPERLIRLYSYWGETVLDPFLGTGTTCLVARKLRRNCIGYEIDLELREAIEERLGVKQRSLVEGDRVEIVVRDDAKHYRTRLRMAIEERLRAKSEESR